MHIGILGVIRGDGTLPRTGAEYDVCIEGIRLATPGVLRLVLACEADGAMRVPGECHVRIAAISVRAGAPLAV